MLIFRHFQTIFSSLITILFALSFAFSSVNASISERMTQEIDANNWISFIDPILGKRNLSDAAQETMSFGILSLSIRESEIRKKFSRKIYIGKRKGKTRNVLDRTIATKKLPAKKFRAPPRVLAQKKSPEKSIVSKIVKKYSIKTKKNAGWQPKGKRLKRIYRIAAKQKILTKKALQSSFRFYEKNKKRKSLSKKYIVIADYTKYSTKKRLHLVSLKTGKIKSFFVSHAINSGPVGGKVLRTSNRVGSNQTSKGFFKVGYREGVTATKKYDYLTVRGLGRKNRKVGWPTKLGGRDVIIHTAKYANTGGRSEGCFVIRPKDRRAIFNRIKGSLFYSYVG